MHNLSKWGSGFYIGHCAFICFYWWLNLWALLLSHTAVLAGEKSKLVMNHRIKEWLGLEGTSGDLVQFPAKAGSPGAGCTWSCPGGFGVSPEKESQWPSWAACSNALSSSKENSFFSYLDRTLCLCQLPLVFLLGTTVESLAASSGHLPLRYLYW